MKIKVIAMLLTLFAATFPARAQDPLLDSTFRSFQVFFETVPFPNQPAQIAVRFQSCLIPYSQLGPEFPTETQIVGSEITLTFAFAPLNIPDCVGRIVRYALPTLQQGPYRITVNARYIRQGSIGFPSQIRETRSIAQINFVVGEPLATQVPLLSPVGLALSCLMMLGVGAFVSGRRGA